MRFLLRNNALKKFEKKKYTVNPMLSPPPPPLSNKPSPSNKPHRLSIKLPLPSPNYSSLINERPY